MMWMALGNSGASTTHHNAACTNERPPRAERLWGLLTRVEKAGNFFCRSRGLIFDEDYEFNHQTPTDPDHGTLLAPLPCSKHDGASSQHERRGTFDQHTDQHTHRQSALCHPDQHRWVRAKECEELSCDIPLSRTIHSPSFVHVSQAAGDASAGPGRCAFHCCRRLPRRVRVSRTAAPTPFACALFVTFFGCDSGMRTTRRCSPRSSARSPCVRSSAMTCTTIRTTSCTTTSEEPSQASVLRSTEARASVLRGCPACRRARRTPCCIP